MLIGKSKHIIKVGILKDTFVIGKMVQTFLIGKICLCAQTITSWVLTTGTYDNSKYWKNDAIYKNNP